MSVCVISIKREKMRNIACRQRVSRALALFTAVTPLVFSSAASAQISISPENGRGIIGTTVYPVFDLTNNGPGTNFAASLSPNLQFVYNPTGSTPVTVPGGQNLSSYFFNNSTATVNAPMLLGDTPGFDATETLTVTPTSTPSSANLPNGTPVVSTVHYSELAIRPLSGSVDLGNLGRYMASTFTPVTLSVSGGALADNAATRITVTQNGFAYAGGIEIQNQGGSFTYNGSNQTHNFTIVPRGGSYNYANTSLSTLPVTQYSSPSNTPLYGGDSYYEDANYLLTAENLPGSGFNVSGITFTGSGDALFNRTISDGYLYLGRFMQNGPVTTTTANGSTGLTSFESDDIATRLKLDAFDTTQNGIEATLPNAVVFNTSTQATVQLHGTIPLIKTTLGAVYNTVAVGSNISSLENLPGERPQTSLTTGTVYNVLQDNVAIAQPVNVYTYGNEDLSRYRFSNPTVAMQYDTDTHTYLRLSSYFTLPNSQSTTVTISTANGGIVGEGLPGENDQSSLSYAANVVTVQHANLVGPSSQLSDGSVFTLTNNVSGLAADAYTNLSMSGNASLFNVSNNGVPLSPTLSHSYDLAPGQSMSWNVSVNTNLLPVLPPNSLGVKYLAYITATTSDYFRESSQFVNPASGYANLYGYGYSSTQNFVLSAVVPGTAVNSGSAVLQPGSDLNAMGLTLTSTNETTASLIGSEKLAAQTTVSLAFTSTSNASSGMQQAPGFDQLQGDIVTITGLDHVQQVLEMNYNGSANAIDWYDAADQMWVNSILGNYNITNLNFSAGTLDVYGVQENITDYLASMRYNESYGDYLASLPAGQTLPPLGTYGVDYADHTVWAVIDHNSSFAVVPEPTSMVLLSAGALSLLGRRLRRSV
jgi:hypothetical protein